MSMLKKIGLWVFSVVLLFIVAACGGGGNSNTNATNGNNATQTTTPTTSTTTTTPTTIDPATVAIPPSVISATPPPAPTFETMPPPIATSIPVVATPTVVSPVAPPISTITTSPSTNIAPTLQFDSAVMLSDGTSIYFVGSYNQDVFVEKRSLDGKTVNWRKTGLATTDSDTVVGSVYYNGTIYMLCSQSDTAGNNIAVWFVKVGTANDSSAAIAKSILAKSYAAGLAVDSITGLLYSQYTNQSGAQFAIQLDQNGNILQGAPRISSEEFSKHIAVGNDGVYYVGRTMQSGARSRIWVMKFSKDLQTRLWSAQYRNFSDSSKGDSATSVTVAPNENILVGGTIANDTETHQELLEFSSTNGSLAHSWKMPTNTFLSYLISDPAGYVYMDTPISKFNLSSGSFVWQTNLDAGNSMVIVGNKLYARTSSMSGPADPNAANSGAITIIDTAN